MHFLKEYKSPPCLIKQIKENTSILINHKSPGYLYRHLSSETLLKFVTPAVSGGWKYQNGIFLTYWKYNTSTKFWTKPPLTENLSLHFCTKWGEWEWRIAHSLFSSNCAILSTRIWQMVTLNLFFWSLRFWLASAFSSKPRVAGFPPKQDLRRMSKSEIK